LLIYGIASYVGLVTWGTMLFVFFVSVLAATAIVLNVERPLLERRQWFSRSAPYPRGKVVAPPTDRVALTPVDA
jgi:hypothetical protein